MYLLLSSGCIIYYQFKVIRKNTEPCYQRNLFTLVMTSNSANIFIHTGWSSSTLRKFSIYPKCLVFVRLCVEIKARCKEHPREKFLVAQFETNIKMRRKSVLYIFLVFQMLFVKVFSKRKTLQVTEKWNL